MPASSNGTAYDVIGSTDHPAVVLIHGLGLTRQSTWGGMIDGLANRYRVIAYDLPGHGESALPAATISLAMLGRHLVELLDELEIGQAALVGFSLGGMINRRCAMDFPERVSALAILNSPHERGDEQQELVEQRARDTSDGGPAATIDATLARWFTEEFRSMRPDVVARIREIVLANDHMNYAAHRQVLAQGVRELIRPEPPITHPSLALTCENDSGSTPGMSAAIAAEIKGCELAIVPRLQHLGLIEQPELFSRPILQFLDRALG